MPFSKARYSAAVRATLGVISLSTTGSLARFRYITTWSDTPLSSKVRRKNSATSILYTHCRKDNGKVLIIVASKEACCTIWAASWSWGSPLPEKIGSFCPRIRVCQSVNGREIPVWIKFLGYSLVTGFSGRPLMFRTQFGSHRPQTVDGPSDTVKGSAKYFRRQIDLHRVPLSLV